MHRRTAAAGLAAAVAITLVACSGADTRDDESIELTVSTWTANEPGLADWWPVLAEGFEDKHENVTVEIRQISFADYITQITTQLIATSAPEVIHVPTPTTTLPAWAEAGFLADMDDFLAGTDIPAEWPAAQEVMAWDDTDYGVMLVDYGFVLFYNEAMLAEAGVDVPTTPDDLVAASEAVTEMPGDQLGFAITDDNSPNFVRDALVFIAGMQAPWIRDGEWNLDHPDVAAAFDVWRTLGSQFAPQGTDIAQKREAFLTGNVAMMIEGPFYYPTVTGSADPELVDSMHVAMTPFKAQPGDVSHGLSVPAGLDDETEALAEDFVAYAASSDMMSRYAEMATSPVARPGADESLRDDDATAPIAESADAAEPIVPHDLQGLRSDYDDFTTLAADHLHQLLRSDADTAEVLADLQEALDAEGITP